jgi:hypothetical protein
MLPNGLQIAKRKLAKAGKNKALVTASASDLQDCVATAWALAKETLTEREPKHPGLSGTSPIRASSEYWSAVQARKNDR